MAGMFHHRSYIRSAESTGSIAPLLQDASLLLSTNGFSTQVKDVGASPRFVELVPSSMNSAERDMINDAHTPGDGETSADAAAGWSRCASLLQDRDEAQFKAWNVNIDALLTFAALFSGVVTAFVVQLYPLLQPNPAITTALILAQVSAQLGSFSISSGYLNSTQPPFLVPAFHPPQSAIGINSLLYASLVFSLSAAFIAILVKQWLNNYTDVTDQHCDLSRDAARLREFRHSGLLKWRVPMIISLVPVILQIALVLFFAALVNLFWWLQSTVALVATVLVAIILIFCAITLVLPLIYTDCPYRFARIQDIFIIASSMMQVFLAAQSYMAYCAWSIRKAVRSSRLCQLLTSKHALSQAPETRPLRLGDSWESREKQSVDALKESLDSRVVRVAGSLLMSRNLGLDLFVQVMQPCLSQLKKPDGFLTLYHILTTRGLVSAQTQGHLWPIEQFFDFLIKFNRKGDHQLQVMAAELFFASWSARWFDTAASLEDIIRRFPAVLQAFRSGSYAPKIREQQLLNMQTCLAKITHARCFGTDGVKDIAGCIPKLIEEQDVQGTLAAYQLLLVVLQQLRFQELNVVRDAVQDVLLDSKRIVIPDIRDRVLAKKRASICFGYLAAILNGIVNLASQNLIPDFVPSASVDGFATAARDLTRGLDWEEVFVYEGSEVENAVQRFCGLRQ
ncbi:hypothetical protein AcV5_010266 [Taiwanofungus camphoratus]|nr:hypothetical protein AcV5_010266 [Antrodia cinnamomea]